MIHVRDIDHLVLRVVDLDAMLHFYRDALGCTVARQRDDIGLVQLQAGSSMIDLVPVDGKLGRAGGAPPGRQARNMDHFCLRVEPFDEAAIRAHLAKHGVAAGPVEQRFGAEGEGPSMYLTDPEGNVVELKGPPVSPTIGAMQAPMTNPAPLSPFHLAFPVHDLEAARAFYGKKLGCPEGRSSADWVDFNFYGHQIVAHLAPGEAGPAQRNAVDGHGVPVRHFGIVLPMGEWDALATRLKAANTEFVIEPYTRFKGEPGEQATMFFMDPSGNAIEVKAFADIGQLFAT